MPYAQVVNRQGDSRASIPHPLVLVALMPPHASIIAQYQFHLTLTPIQSTHTFST